MALSRERESAGRLRRLGLVGGRGVDRGERGAGLDRDRLRLQRLGHFAHQVDRQQAIVEACILDPDEIGQLEPALEAAGGDAEVQIGRLVAVLVLLAPDGQQVLLGDDLDLVAAEAGDRDRDAIVILGGALEVEGRVIVGRRPRAGLQQVEQPVEADGPLMGIASSHIWGVRTRVQEGGIDKKSNVFNVRKVWLGSRARRSCF